MGSLSGEADLQSSLSIEITRSNTSNGMWMGRCGGGNTCSLKSHVTSLWCLI